MPIIGTSDRVRLSRLGKIRLGIKVQSASGAAYPKQVDYFVVNEDDATSADSAASFHDVYGAEPRELDIAFPTEDPEEWAGQWLRMYTQSWGLACRGNGDIATAKIDPDTGTWANRESKDFVLQEITGCGETCPNYQGKPPRCRPVMSLQFLLPQVRGLGIWQIDSSSFHSMRAINSQVKLIKALVGRISLLPLKLRIVPLKVQPPGQKPKTVHVLDLQAPVTLAELQRSGLALPSPQVVLPAADEEEPEDLVEVEEAEEVEALPPARAGAAPIAGYPTRPTFRERLAENIEPPPGAVPPPENGAPPPMDKVGDLFNACLKRWGDTSGDVMRVAGVTRPEAIATNHLADIYRQVEYHHQLKGEGGNGEPAGAPE